MSMSTSKLRLGPLPQSATVKLTITLQSDVKASLDRYAALHSQQHGQQVDAIALIPHMLTTFLERDRGFKSLAAKAIAPRSGIEPDR